MTGVDWDSVRQADNLAALYGWRWEPEDAALPSPVRVSATPAHGDGGLVLVPHLWERLQAFGRTMSPHECCGVGIGPPGEVREFHPVENVHESPVTRYEISAADQLRLYRRAEERGWDVTLVFHTHPATDPVPSATDRALAGWPAAVYAILGLGGERADLRAWRIVDGGEPAQLEIRAAD